MIADKVNISKSNLYHYFKNKEELFYELTDSAAEGLKNLILHASAACPSISWTRRNSNSCSPRRYPHCCWPKIWPAAHHGAGQGSTRYEHLRPTMIALIANRSNRCWRTRGERAAAGADHGTQSGGRDGTYPQEPRSPERGPCRTESADRLSHKGIRALSSKKRVLWPSNGRILGFSNRPRVHIYTVTAS